jgi:hypothetical protein
MYYIILYWVAYRLSICQLRGIFSKIDRIHGFMHAFIDPSPSQIMSPSSYILECCLEAAVIGA